MKYKSKIQNAKSKAEEFVRSGFAFVVLAMTFIILISALLHLAKMNQINQEKARSGILMAIQTDMAKCEQIGRKMQYAGANIRGELLPELKLYLYSLNHLQKAFSDSFGEDGSPIQAQFLSKVKNAVERLEYDYNAGYSAQKSEKALFECLNEFGNLLRAIEYR